MGYVRQSGVERFRIEMFGGTVAYDGSAEYQDQNGTWQDEPYHQSFGTNYLGCRGEYELLRRTRRLVADSAFSGRGNSVLDPKSPECHAPRRGPVAGYDETWWTFYPYVGLETRDSDEPGLKFLG